MTEEEIEKLSLQERKELAQSPNTPPQVLGILAKDKDRVVRRGVPGNPNTSIQALDILAKDEDWGVRREVAENPNTPSQVLDILAKDKDWVVRYKVAKHSKNITIDQLLILGQDEDEEVRQAALERI